MLGSFALQPRGNALSECNPFAAAKARVSGKGKRSFGCMSADSSFELKPVKKSSASGWPGPSRDFRPLKRTKIVQKPSAKATKPTPKFKKAHSKTMFPPADKVKDSAGKLRMEVLKKDRRSSGSGKMAFTSIDAMHPSHAICRLNTKNGELTERIMRLEEQTVYWRRKSTKLEKERDCLKGELSKARIQIEKLDTERLKLQELLFKAEADAKVCESEIKRLTSENTDLESIVSELSEELSMFSKMETTTEANSDATMTETPSEEAMVALDQALRDTLADLTDKIEEIEQLKRALADVTMKKSQLETAVTRHTVLAEMMSLGQGGDLDDQKDQEGSEEVAKITVLQKAVEKCMFRIALLSEKNEQYKTVIRHSRERSGLSQEDENDPGLLETLSDGQKVKVLESLCMQRYRTLLRQTAQQMIGTNAKMDESF